VSEDAGLKFVSDVKRLVIGEFEHAADGLPAVLGIEEDELNALTMQGACYTQLREAFSQNLLHGSFFFFRVECRFFRPGEVSFEVRLGSGECVESVESNLQLSD
jgi:hypothetical protein